MLAFLHEKIPGIEVDAPTFARMEGLDPKRRALRAAESPPR